MHFRLLLLGAVYIVRAQYRGRGVSATLKDTRGRGGPGPAHMCIWKRIIEGKSF